MRRRRLLRQADGGRPALGGRTQFTALFGHPVEHSLSPAMHNAAYAALGIDRAYVAFDVEPAALAHAVRAIPALGLLGVNLTVPHKLPALKLVDLTSREARLLGAVNCIANRGGRLAGDNTDARGLLADLRDLGVVPKGRLAIVIGAGGGAAAAVLACSRLGASRIVVVNRTVRRADALARRFTRRDHPRVDARGLNALLDAKLMGEAALIINATPLGLTSQHFVPLEYSATSADCFFYDLIYARRPTPFLRLAIQINRRTADGAGMLLHQGARAFRLFNRVPAPLDAMRRALYDQLGRPLPLQ